MDVHLEITIQEREPLSISTVEQGIPSLNIEERIVEAIVELVDAQLTG